MYLQTRHYYTLIVLTNLLVSAHMRVYVYSANVPVLVFYCCASQNRRIIQKDIVSNQSRFYIVY